MNKRLLAYAFIAFSCLMREAQAAEQLARLMRCATHYDALRTTVVGARMFASRPDMQHFVNNNFNALFSMASLVTLCGTGFFLWRFLRPNPILQSTPVSTGGDDSQGSQPTSLSTRALIEQAESLLGTTQSTLDRINRLKEEAQGFFTREEVLSVDVVDSPLLVAMQIFQQRHVPQLRPVHNRYTVVFKHNDAECGKIEYEMVNDAAGFAAINLLFNGRDVSFNLGRLELPPRTTIPGHTTTTLISPLRQLQYGLTGDQIWMCISGHAGHTCMENPTSVREYTISGLYGNLQHLPSYTSGTVPGTDLGYMDKHFLDQTTYQVVADGRVIGTTARVSY